jgi:hypothetical protein
VFCRVDADSLPTRSDAAYHARPQPEPANTPSLLVKPYPLFFAPKLLEPQLAAWIADQAWMTGDGPKVIFGGAVAWLRTRQTLLPGITRLQRCQSCRRGAPVV